MKFSSNCCCWLTLLLVGSSIISVSPNSSTTATTTFQKHHRQQSIYIQSPRSSTSLLPTATNKFESLENYPFASTTMSPQAGLLLAQHQYHQQQQQQQQQYVPGSLTSVQQMVTFITTPASPISTRTSSSSSSFSSSSSSSSSLSSSTMPAKRPASVDISSNSIRRKGSSIRSVDDDDNDDSSYAGGSSSISSSAVTGAMVHHHYPEQKPTESYPSMFFHIDASLKEHRQYREQISNNIRRSKRNDVDNEDIDGMDKCHTFVVGEPEQNLLYSPDYPNDYPKNINCTRIIEAPKGQLIRLDFRNSFNIENKEDCKFDYLEIRDGPYGFSNLIGKYCGEEFPPMITSKERHLWLHFHSDESIEYSGFTAVYEFIDRPKEAISTELNCTIRKDGYEGFINSTDVPEYVQSNVTKYKIPLDCMWIIQVQPAWKIQVKFLHFSLNKPNDCDINFIDIFAKDTNIPSRMKNFCGSTGEPLTSESNILHIRFYAEQIAINSSFSILYTAFKDKGPNPCNATTEYDCEDATCIAADLKCNGRANCKFRWDEEACETEEVQMSEHLQIIIVVFGLILGGMVATFVWNCVRKIMRDQKIIREHIRQSKESKLDEMGRSRSRSKQRSRDNVSGVMSPRQKHSQTSLQILDDVSQRYYREAVPISVQAGKTDLKDHSILRHHHDMVVQTSLCDDSSTPDRGIITGVGSGNVCDMGCQTRESLFQPQLARQKSITSSSPNQSTAAAIRFSTFGYDVPPPPAHGGGQKSGTLSRQSSINNHPESIELEERLRTASHNSQHHYSHTHGHMYSTGGSGDNAQMPAMRPPQEMCHHHHQHQQHLQKHQMQQQQQQQQQMPASNTGTIGSHHHSHQAPPGVKTGSGSGTTSGGGTGTGKHHKLDETSKVFIDIRNSAPDVIIMTSH